MGAAKMGVDARRVRKNERGRSVGDNGSRSVEKAGGYARWESTPMEGPGKTLDEGVVYAAAAGREGRGAGVKIRRFAEV